ncbi:hypothetical protein [Algicella marina]|uniref:Uncharacterized protein n=1 Tax=Algicella marina TaxID=2683284 RepID=A0A6P1SYI5_9RHOB|nr:hypothetical protein [Algicella marina]QHQ34817.1 hypothetical protein GO499_06195 [Algicella marina]
MSGNASEEGLLMQLGNPSHFDPARFGVMFGLVVASILCWLLLAALPGVNPLWLVVLWLVLVCTLAAWMTRRLQARLERREAMRAAEMREIEARERARQMEEAKADGRFSGFGRGRGGE